MPGKRRRTGRWNMPRRSLDRVGRERFAPFARNAGHSHGTAPVSRGGIAPSSARRLPGGGKAAWESLGRPAILDVGHPERGGGGLGGDQVSYRRAGGSWYR